MFFSPFYPSKLLFCFRLTGQQSRLIDDNDPFSSTYEARQEVLSNVLSILLLEVSFSSQNDEKPDYGCVSCSLHNIIVGYRR